MTVHPVTAADIPRMICLLRQVGGVHHDLRPDLFRQGAQKYGEAALEELLRDPDRPIFGAYREGTLVGYCFCIRQSVQGDPVLRDRRTLYIDDLCVDEGCRRQGIAKALYDCAVAYAREEGFDAVTLNVWEGNSAEAFYRKMGMTTQKTVMELVL
ncbi:MAG: GNAT family N-acetyltransferase [Clostridia bacterium]|nr:GNAT family N-acetyltransferase [Clostridia bacterium]